MGFLDGLNVSLTLVLGAGPPVAAGGVVVEQGPVAQYAPDGDGFGYESSLGPFAEELAPYGSFVGHERFGVVFVPAQGFEPYRNGRWVHSQHGLTWQSYEPIGWIVEHYGRWAFTPEYGWIWIPGRDWAPAWVEWREVDGYVAWAPLAPSGVAIHVGAFRCVSPRHLFDDRLPSYYVPSPRYLDRGHRFHRAPDRGWLRRHHLPSRTIRIPVRRVEVDERRREIDAQRRAVDAQRRAVDAQRRAVDARRREWNGDVHPRHERERLREERARLREEHERLDEARERRLEDLQRERERRLGIHDPDAAYQRRQQQQARREAQQERRRAQAERRLDQKRRRDEARERRGGWGVRPDIDARDLERDRRDVERALRDRRRDLSDRERDLRDRERDRRYFERR